MVHEIVGIRPEKPARKITSNFNSHAQC